MSAFTISAGAVWVLLIGQSVLALALLLAGVAHRLRDRHVQRAGEGLAASFLGHLRFIAWQCPAEKIPDQMRTIEKAFGATGRRESGLAISASPGHRARGRGTSPQHHSSGVPELVRHLLNRDANPSSIEIVVGLHTATIERGALRLCGFLARVAPLVGLGGTVLGIQQALAGYADHSTDLMASFGLALQTTLAGVAIAFVALLTARLIWEPLLHRATARLLDLSLEAQSLLASAWRRVQEPPERLAAQHTAHGDTKLRQGPPEEAGKPQAPHGATREKHVPHDEPADSERQDGPLPAQR